MKSNQGDEHKRPSCRSHLLALGGFPSPLCWLCAKGPVSVLGYAVSWIQMGCNLTCPLPLRSHPPSVWQPGVCCLREVYGQRELGLPLVSFKGADRNEARRGLTRGDVRVGTQTSIGTGPGLLGEGLLLPLVSVITCHSPGPQENICMSPLEANDGSAASWPWSGLPEFGLNLSSSIRLLMKRIF